MLLNIRAMTDGCDDQEMAKFRRYGAKAVQLNCFKFLYDMESHPMFNNDTLVSKVVRQTVYDLLNFSCDLFDGDKYMGKQTYIYELI